MFVKRRFCEIILLCLSKEDFVNGAITCTMLILNDGTFSLGIAVRP